VSYIGIYSVYHEPNALFVCMLCNTFVQIQEQVVLQEEHEDPVLQDEHEDPREICIIATEDRHVPRHQSDCD
jgi:hypothetical protein